MSLYPESADVFTPKTGSDNIASSDPNNAFDGVEAIQGLIGALGKPQSWSETLVNALRNLQEGMRIEILNGVLKVRAGEAMLVSTGGNKFVFRRNPSDVTLSASNIDVGTLAATTYYIYAKGDGAATTAPICFSTDINAPSAIGTAPYKKLGWFENAGAGALTPTYGGSDHGGAVVNIVNFQTGAVATGTGIIPEDNTKPQKTEGDEYMTLAIAPTKSTNKLKIEVVLYFANDTNSTGQVALFQDAIADAIAAGQHHIDGVNTMGMITFTHYMTAGTTARIIFRVRAGSSAGGTTTFNGEGGVQRYNGVLASSITITEIET